MIPPFWQIVHLSSPLTQPSALSAGAHANTGLRIANFLDVWMPNGPLTANRCLQLNGPATSSDHAIN
jgi:hypothetical protein